MPHLLHGCMRRPAELEWFATLSWNVGAEYCKETPNARVVSLLHACAELWAVHPHQDMPALTHQKVGRQ